MFRAPRWVVAGVTAALACAVSAVAAPPISPPTAAEIEEARALFAGEDAADDAALGTAMTEFRAQRERMCAALDRAFDPGDEAQVRAALRLALAPETKAGPTVLEDRAARLARNAPLDVVAVNFASPARARTFLRDAANDDASASLDAGARIDRWSARMSQLMHALQCAEFTRALEVVGALQQNWPLTEPDAAVLVAARSAIERVRDSATSAAWNACIDSCAALDPSKRFEFARLTLAWNAFDGAQSVAERALALDAIVRVTQPEVVTDFGLIVFRPTNGVEWAEAQRVRIREPRARELNEIADAKRKSGHEGQAELIYAQVSDRFPRSKSWARATKNSGELLREMGQPQAAIERIGRMFVPDVPTEDERVSVYLVQWIDFRGAAIEISGAYEDLSRFEDALDWLKKAREFPCGSGCSIGIDVANRQLEQAIAGLEHLLKK